MLPLLLGRAPICGEAVAPCDMLKPIVMFDIAPFRPKIAQTYFKFQNIFFFQELKSTTFI